MDNTSFIDIYSGFSQSNTLKAPWFLVRFPNLANLQARHPLGGGGCRVSCLSSRMGKYVYIYVCVYIYTVILCIVKLFYAMGIIYTYIYIHICMYLNIDIHIYIWCSWKYALHTLGCVQNLKGEELFTASRPLNSARQHKDGGIGEFGEFPGIVPGENPKCW
jgi:hypothetical protein